MKINLVIIKVFILFISTNCLDFLEDLPLLEFEFVSTCGNSYLTKTMIINNIVEQLRKSGFTKFDFLITNISSIKKDLPKNHFKIYLIQRQEDKEIIASSYIESPLFDDILLNYPKNLYLQKYATDEEKDLIQIFISKILLKIRSLI